MSKKATRRLYRYIYGNWFTMITRTYAELNIATLLSDCPRTVSELATKTQTHPETLAIFLRAAEDMEFHTMDPDTGKLHLTETGSLLSETTSGNLRAAAILNGSDYRYEPWGRLPEYVQNGSGHGLSPTWEEGSLPYLANHPEQLAVFQQAMRDLSESNLTGSDENTFIAQSVNFSDFPRIIDIGGGTGSLASAIQQESPQSEITLFDLEEVFEAIPQTKQENPSIHHRAGNFFEEIPSGYSAYVFKNILHNHRPDRLNQVFSHLAKALSESGPNARAFFFELLREDDQPGPSRNSLTDLNLNLLVGGRIRSREEYNDILSPHRLRIVSVQSIPLSIRMTLEIEYACE